MFDELRDVAASVWPEFIERMVTKVGEVVELKTAFDDDSTLNFQVRTIDARLMLISEFKLSKLPGTLWLYSHGAHVCEPCRGNGVGALLNEFRIRIAQESGAWGLLAFVRGDNIAQRKVMMKNGWVLRTDVALSDGGRVTQDEIVDDPLYVQEIWTYVVEANFGVRG